MLRDHHSGAAFNMPEQSVWPFKAFLLRMFYLYDHVLL